MLDFDTIAIPVTKGLNLKVAARLVEPPSLLEAINSRFTGAGSSKRYGHSAYRARVGPYPANTAQVTISPPVITPYGSKVLDADWLYGWGIITGDGDNDPVSVSPYPEPGLLLGGFERDNELVAWTGHTLISHTPSQTQTPQGSLVGPACIPAANVVPIAKTGEAQHHPDTADNGRVRVVVWLSTQDEGPTAELKYSAFDSVTGAILVSAETLGATTQPYYPRIVSMGGWFHAFVLEQDDDTLKRISFHENSLASFTTTTLDQCDGWYDLWKESEFKTVVLVSYTNTLTLHWLAQDGQAANDEDSGSTVDVDADTPNECAVSIHPVTGHLGIVYNDTTGNDVYGGVFTRNGEKVNDSWVLVDSTNYTNIRLAVAPTYLTVNNLGQFDGYISRRNSDNNTELLRVRFEASGPVGSTYNLWHHSVMSQGIRAGNRTYVWVGHVDSLLQSTFFLVDETLRQVGCVNYGVAVVTPGDSDNLPTYRSVNWSDTGAAKDRLVYHMALPYKVRVETTNEQEGLYTEPSIQFLKLDFLPKLHSVQAGRSTFVAGAQLWAYDGQEFVEAGFHLAPEFTLEADTATQSGGLPLGLEDAQVYSYRIDLCYRNAQNEEVRSHSFIGQVTSETGVNNEEPTPDTVPINNITIRTCLTRRANSYFLIFRNAIIAGAPTSTWNLLNSRDPLDASYIANDPSVPEVTYTDDGSVLDTQIITRELHPGNSQTYIHPFPSPACEVIAGGRDRVWLAGGELPFGMIAPSRLFAPGETPLWSGNLVLQIDRGEAPITGIGFVGDLTVVFRERYTYVQEGDGPDNQGAGFWPPARLALADTGAVDQAGIILGTPGLLFQSPTGIRLIGPGAQLVSLGEPVDSIVTGLTINDATIIPAQNEVRWYHDTGAIVYNYYQDAWSTWTCGAVAALRGSRDTHAVLVRSDGYFWVETPGLYDDGGTNYEHRVRFPWLHAGHLFDFQRLKRFGGFGTWDVEQPHKVRVELFHDEREFPSEYWEWDVPDASQNTDTWGAGTWGAGTWGDTTVNRAGRDSVWRFRKMPRRQKCSVFSLSISDGGGDGPGFSLVGIGLEIARKKGLDKIRAPGGTVVSRP